jgi:flagellar biosynthetic protein FlhB
MSSENTTPEQRTEMPTDKRMGKLREKGQIHHSQEIVSVVGLMTGFIVLTLVWQSLFDDLKLVFTYSFKMVAYPEQLDLEQVYSGAIGLIKLMGPELAIIVITTALLAALALLIQTKFNVKKNKIEFQWHFLNPISGIKRIFSIHGLMNVAKALVKLAIILPIGYFALRAFAPQMVKLVHLDIPAIMTFASNGVSTLFWQIVAILIGMSIFDYFWGRYQWLKVNKMTKEEVKDERKELEGDEETKKKIIAKGLGRILQRIRSNVQKADVVVTNPTHYAVALQYDRKTMKAPRVVAKGADFLALRIRELAKEANVPVLERKVLARALYSSTEVGAEIPYELFKAVAEVLAYVYRLKGLLPSGNNAANAS